ncbi:unnamed protein product [Lampetra planeri]
MNNAWLDYVAGPCGRVPRRRENHVEPSGNDVKDELLLLLLLLKALDKGHRATPPSLGLRRGQLIWEASVVEAE